MRSSEGEQVPSCSRTEEVGLHKAVPRTAPGSPPAILRTVPIIVMSETSMVNDSLLTPY